MKSIKIIMLAVLMTFLASMGYFQNVQAKQHDFTIINKSDQDVVIKLRGDKSYYIEVPAGKKVTEAVDGDTYKVTYKFCGTDYDWKLKHNEDFKMTLYPCENQPTKMQIKSHLGVKVDVKLYGYEDYELNIKPGKTRVDVFSGNMTYEYEACNGQVFSGEVFVTKNGKTQLLLHSCEWYTQPARIYGQPNPVKFRIVNQASFPVILTLIGPENYLVTANAGVNIFTLISGNYKYSYYQDGQLVSGNMLVTKNGIGVLVITPSYVIDFVDNSQDLE